MKADKEAICKIVEEKIINADDRLHLIEALTVIAGNLTSTSNLIMDINITRPKIASVIDSMAGVVIGLLEDINGRNV